MKMCFRHALPALLLVVCVVGSLDAMMDVNNGGGEIIRGLPCVKRLNQLFCPSAGTNYPNTFIEKFIDDNKALMRRMYGELQQTTTVTTVRVVRTFNGISRFRRDVLEGTLEEMEAQEEFEAEEAPLEEELEGFNATSTSRGKRQADFPGAPETNTNKEDVCESKIEIVTPYWASNSNGKVRAILNNKAFEQAIHQEICSGSATARCTRDCSCEQKYKWHRLLAYDPNNDCAGVFMDWFLFPSCCVCRCNKNPFLSNTSN
ncbi:protein spaetzle 3 isoform X2 [Eurytemora carolleeae]|uniref:protein spaetzle 3 isoform X2 n=1 Tax=Eurytemora carolleeae TaxID=1294199 RepID=UPI000C75E664|nr:protein spaetzle 3 isoform X2 [Eurytemora carolleeae]|eukprot:XP_023339638.1 protein spaetzle 3-like isoform X2 [Eurytemora affinis]